MWLGSCFLYCCPFHNHLKNEMVGAIRNKCGRPAGGPQAGPPASQPAHYHGPRAGRLCTCWQACSGRLGQLANCRPAWPAGWLAGQLLGRCLAAGGACQPADWPASQPLGQPADLTWPSRASRPFPVYSLYPFFSQWQ